MSTPLTAQPTLYMAPTNVRNVAVSFVGQLANNDLLSGVPTLAVNPSGAGLTVSGPLVNASTMKIESPDKPHNAQAGQAVTFTVTCANATVQAYVVTVTCPTAGGQSLVEYVNIVVSTS